MRHLLLLLYLLLTTAASFSQNQPPVIDNIDINFNAADQMTITYDLQDAENDDAEISLRVSDDNGKTYTINTSGATGDIGYPVLPGNGKVIQWNYSGQIDMDGNYKLMLVADDRQPVDIQALVDGVDSTRLRNDLEVIEGVRHRTTGATHLENVKALIADRFDMYGLEDESVSWDRGGYDAKNIIGTKRGLSDQAEIYIIDGHFDTVDDSPGADDNGSAVAGVLEAARILAPYHFDKTIKFIGFDLEEAGLVGSNHFVNVDGLKAYETVGGVFNLEMIGYFNNTPNSQTFPFGFEQIYPQVYDTVRRDSFRGNFITNVGIETHPDLNQAFEDAATQYVPDLKVISLLATERWLLLTP
ncbi:MAG: M28 family peptidase, partial [Saprospiraceae bacterium]|nr:M28 family peptidase [Saprospiraceae bacterium]